MAFFPSITTQAQVVQYEPSFVERNLPPSQSIYQDLKINKYDHTIVARMDLWGFHFSKVDY